MYLTSHRTGRRVARQQAHPPPKPQLAPTLPAKYIDLDLGIAIDVYYVSFNRSSSSPAIYIYIYTYIYTYMCIDRHIDIDIDIDKSIDR